MTHYLHGEDPYTPESFIAARDNAGPRRSIQRILSLVDTTDPAWPHIAGTLRDFAEAGIGLDEVTIPMAVKLGKRRRERFDADPGIAAAQEAPAGSIVYYIRRAGLIKIGTTADPHSRFKDLLPDEILAFEPGDRVQETARHRQFWHLHESGEYFADAPDLREHISRTLSAYGPPDPAWPTVAALYEGAPGRTRRRMIVPGAR